MRQKLFLFFILRFKAANLKGHLILVHDFKCSDKKYKRTAEIYIIT